MKFKCIICGRRYFKEQLGCIVIPTAKKDFDIEFCLECAKKINSYMTDVLNYEQEKEDKYNAIFGNNPST